MATLDPAAFLRSAAPFQALAADRFDAAARAADVASFPAGTVLARAGGAPFQHLHVIGKGSVRLVRDGQTLQILEEGEAFGYTSIIAGEATLDVIVDEDLVAVRIPAEVFKALLADAQFAGYFAAGLADRLKATLAHSPVATFRSDLSRAVGELVRRKAVWVDAGATVGQTARVMRDEGVSSVIVRTAPPTIVTDRDFRNRVLAEGRGPDTPVTAISTGSLRTVPAATPIYEAWTTLLDARVHHLPVVRDGEIVGVLTAGDLQRHSAEGPVAVLRGVERLAGRESLPGYAARVTEMTAALVAGKLDVGVIAGFVARLNDVLVRRILRWAEQDLGPPPAPYAWIVLGSEGRMEQTLLTDQDNALVYADEGAPRREWYQALADRVNADLESAGFPRCAGGYMANRWNAPLSEWAARFAAWMDEPSAQGILEASIFFDYRRIAGDLSLEPLDRVAAAAARKPLFLRYLARAAMDFKPPGMLMLRLRGDASEVDLKANVISPVVNLARCYALEAGAAAHNTFERIAAAARAKLIEAGSEEVLAEAYRFVLGLRLRLQLRCLADERPLPASVALSQLTAVERSRLKEACRVIGAWQERAVFHYHTDF